MGRTRTLIGARALIGMALAVTLLLASGTAAPASDPEPAPLGQVPEDATADEVMALTYGISLEEAHFRLTELQPAVGQLNQDLQTEFPTTFSGLYIDQEQGLVVVLSVGPDSHIEAFAKREFFDPSRLHFEGASFTREELEDYLETVKNLQLTGVLDPAKVPTVGLSTDENAVVVTVFDGHADEITPILDSLQIPADALTVLSIQGDIYVDCSSRNDCSPPLRGGIGIKRGTSSSPNSGKHTCSAGFTAKNSIGDQYLLTAGHCYPTNSFVWHNNNRIGGIPSSVSPKYGSHRNIDASRTWVGNADLAYWDDPNGNLSRWIFLSSSKPNFQIRAVFSTFDIQVGTFLCRSGIRTGVRCGPVDMEHTSFCGWVPWCLTDAIQIITCARSRDSGAPVYNDDPGYGIAAGIHSGHLGLNDDSSSCSPDWRVYVSQHERTYASYITNVQSRLNVQVITR